MTNPQRKALTKLRKKVSGKSPSKKTPRRVKKDPKSQKLGYKVNETFYKARKKLK